MIFENFITYRIVGVFCLFADVNIFKIKYLEAK